MCATMRALPWAQGFQSFGLNPAGGGFGVILLASAGGFAYAGVN